MADLQFDDSESDVPLAIDAPTTTPTVRATTGRAAFFRGLGAAAVGAVPDLADSILASVTKLTPLPDFERGSITRNIPFANKDLQAAEVASGVLGTVAESIVVPELTALKAFDTAVRGNRVLRAITASDTQVAKALSRVKSADALIAARDGAQGQAALRSAVNLAGVGVKRDTLVNAARFASFKRTLTQSVATEALIATTLYENDFAVPDHAPSTLLAYASLGIALPAGFDQIAIGATIRRQLQSDSVRLARAKALDAGSGVDEIKESASREALRLAQTKNAQAPAPIGELASRGHFADEAALEGVQLAARNVRTPNAVLDTNLQNAATGNLRLAQTALSKLTSRGILGSPETGFITTATREVGAAERQTLTDLLHQDPVEFQGIEEIGKIDRPLEDIVTNREFTLDFHESRARMTLLDGKASLEDKAAASATLRQIAEKRTHVPVVIHRGEVVPAADFFGRGDPFDGVIERDIGNKTTGGVKARTVLTAKQTGLSLSGDDATVKLPKGSKVDTLSFQESQSLFALGRKFIDTLASDRTFRVDSKASFFHLDLAETLLRERPHDVKIVFPQGMTRESAMVESFAQKVDLLRKRAGGISEGQLPTLREQFNLPPMTALQRAQTQNGVTPVEALIFGGLVGKDVRSMTLQDLRMLAAESRKKAGTLVNAGADEIDILGISLSQEGSPFVRAKDKPAVAPVLAFKRPLSTSLFDNTAIMSRKAEALSDSMALLSNKTASPSVRELSQRLLSDLNADTLLDLSRLDDTLQVASIGNDRIRRGNFQLADFSAAGNPALLAAQRIFRVASSFVEKDFGNFIRNTIPKGSKNTLEKILGDIQRSDNTTSRLLTEQFISARRGFQLSGATKTAADGKLEFVLRDTAANRAQFKFVTGFEMPEGATLPLINGAPLGVDQKAFEAITAFDTIASKLLNDTNTVLRAAGLRELNREPFYIPNQLSRFDAVLFDANNNAMRTIRAATAEQRDRLIAQLRNDPKSILNRNPGSRIAAADAIEQRSSLIDRAQNDFLDPAVPEIQSVKGREITGASASPFATGRTVSDVLKTFRSQNATLPRRVIEVMFKPQIDEAIVRATAAASKAKGRALGFNSREAAAPSAANTFLNSLLGRRATDSATSTIGNLVNPFERFLDVQLANGYSVWSSVLGNRLTAQQYKTEFESAVSQLKSRTPFNDAHKLLEERQLFKVPPDIAQSVGALNDLATRLMLRYDVGHAVVNSMGIATTFPAVALSYLPRAGESLQDVAIRKGFTADVFADSNGKLYSAMSIPKAVGDSLRFMLNPKSHPDWDFAVRSGSLDAAIAEMHKDLGRVKDTATWKVMARKIDKFASFITDKSEEMVVSWSYFTASKLLKDSGIDDIVVRDMVARKMVDEAIGQFSPLNRPQVFQTPGVGSALGLFQTYVFNYYGRLFGYIENRQTRLLAVQTAMQSFMFGAQTVPGFKQYTDLVMNASGGAEDPMLGIYENLPQPLADAVYYGIPSTIGGIVGLNRDSLPAISSRGSVDVRIPGAANLPASLSVAKTLFTGVADGITQFAGANPGITDQQIGEVLQRHVANRPLSAVISMAWTRTLVDGNGNAIADETSSALGAIWRTMGFRTVAQAAEIEGFARFRGAEALRLQRREQLTRSVRSIIRDGSLDEAKAESALRTFLRTGGTPEEFVSFLRRSAKSALMTESERALLQQLSNPGKLDSRRANIIRLFNATHDTSEFDDGDSGESVDGVDAESN